MLMIFAGSVCAQCGNFGVDRAAEPPAGCIGWVGMPSAALDGSTATSIGFLSRISRRSRGSKEQRKRQQKEDDAKQPTAGHTQGSVRFPGSRRPPARWARLEPERSVASVVTILTNQWHVRPPSALLSIVGLTPTASEPGSILDQQQRTLRLGLKRAALKTNAWIISNGSGEGGPGGWVGQAVGNSEIVSIGIMPWAATAERAQLEWARVHLYGNYKHAGERQQTTQLPPICKGRSVTGTLPRSKWSEDDADYMGAENAATFGRLPCLPSSSAHLRAPTDSWSRSHASMKQPARRASLVAGEAPLDKRHSHFLLVEGERDATARLRGDFEDAVHGADHDGSGLGTPLLTVLVNGGADSLLQVHERLKQGLPVVVLPDTGGAALDVANWLESGGTVSSTEEPDQAYEELCEELIPGILTYAARNEDEANADLVHQRHALLTFIDLNEAVVVQEDEVEGDVGFALMQAILRCCQTPKEEVLLAVAWGEVLLLETVLQSNEGIIAPHPAAISLAGRDPFGVSQALNLALLSGNPNMISALIEFGASPTQVDLRRIFVAARNRYRLKGASADCWVAPTDSTGSQPRITDSMKKKRASGRDSKSVSYETASVRSTSCLDRSSSRGGAADRSKSSRRASIKRAIGLGDQLADLGPWDILMDWVPQYRGGHVECRRERGLLQPTWDDLMLWAILTKESACIKPLWARSREPVRTALMACQLCQRLSALPHLRSDMNALREQANQFEDWALAMLDAVDDSEGALPLLTMLPCVEAGIPLWSTSSLDVAAEEVIFAGTSISCKRFGMQYCDSSCPTHALATTSNRLLPDPDDMPTERSLGSGASALAVRARGFLCRRLPTVASALAARHKLCLDSTPGDVLLPSGHHLRSATTVGTRTGGASE